MPTTWAGITLGEARRGFGRIADELVAAGGEGSDRGLVYLAGAGPPAPLPPPRLLGPFDPVLLGWVSRDDLVGAHKGVVTTNGLFRPVALVDGRVVATWGLADGTITIRPLETIAAPTLDALRADGADILRFLGLASHAVAVTTS